jgi:hypothetical protein
MVVPSMGVGKQSISMMKLIKHKSG